MRTAAVLLALAACGHAAKHEAAPEKPVAAALLTPDVVIAKVRGGYMTGVQRCYTRYLKNAGGHGRVVVSFTVNAKGEATEGATSGVPSKLGDCIVAEVARWRFPAPKDGEQSFALPLELIAN
jgi:hypothetical protein